MTVDSRAYCENMTGSDKLVYAIAAFLPAVIVAMLVAWPVAAWTSPTAGGIIRWPVFLIAWIWLYRWSCDRWPPVEDY